MSDFVAGSSFDGWLLKFGNKVVPNKYLAYDDYTATPNQRTEVEAYRDLNNLLHSGSTKLHTGTTKKTPTRQAFFICLMWITKLSTWMKRRRTFFTIRSE